jgi:hypothetical protein
MSAMRIIKCTCKHEHQDSVYGAEMRAHNRTEKGDKSNPQYRCTVCGKLNFAK